MSNITSTISRYNSQPRTTACRTFSKPSLLKRFRYLIEYTDWDEKLLNQEKWINKICFGFIILSSLYFVPVLVLSLLK
jgi:hypothetical protein